MDNLEYVFDLGYAQKKCFDVKYSELVQRTIQNSCKGQRPVSQEDS